MSLTERLDAIYLSPSNPGSFGGIDALYKYAKGEGITRAKVKKYLQSKRTYTKHAAIVRRHQRNPIWSYCIGYEFMADLHDLSALQYQNNRKRFLFVVVDCLSRFTYCVALANKKSDTVLTGFKSILAEAGFSPQNFASDAGSEFINANFQQFLKENNIHQIILRAPLKASLAELHGKLLKQRIYRYMTENNTKRYLDHLSDFVNALNSRKLKSLGDRAPKDVTFENQSEVYMAQLGKYRNSSNVNFTFKKGDLVRLANRPENFRKGYSVTHSEELYVISDAIAKARVPVYKLKDQLGNSIIGTYYAEQLQKVLL